MTAAPTRVDLMSRKPDEFATARARAEARTLADKFRTIARHAAEPPAEGHTRRVVSLAIVDGNDSGGQFYHELILTPVQINLIAVALAKLAGTP